MCIVCIAFVLCIHIHGKARFPGVAHSTVRQAVGRAREKAVQIESPSTVAHLPGKSIERLSHKLASAAPATSAR